MLNKNNLNFLSWEISGSRKRNNINKFILRTGVLFIFFSFTVGIMYTMRRFSTFYEDVILPAIGVTVGLATFFLINQFIPYRSKSYRLDDTGVELSCGRRRGNYKWSGFECFYAYSEAERYFGKRRGIFDKIFPNWRQWPDYQIMERIQGIAKNIEGETFYLQKKSQVNFLSKLSKTFLIVQTEPDITDQVEKFLLQHLPKIRAKLTLGSGLTFYEPTATSKTKTISIITAIVAIGSLAYGTYSIIFERIQQPVRSLVNVNIHQSQRSLGGLSESSTPSIVPTIPKPTGPNIDMFDISNQRIYRNEKYGFEFKYSNQFYIVSESLDDVALDSIEFKGKEQFRRFTKISVYLNFSLEKFLSGIVNEMTGEKYNITKLERISDNPILHKIYVNYSDSSFQGVAIQGNIYVYIASGSGPTVDQILSTFKFTK